MQSPEELAREKIDKLLTECGWIIQNRSAINLSAGRGIAIREALLKNRDEADYLLFVGGKAIGTVEAKPEGYTLTGALNSQLITSAVSVSHRAKFLLFSALQCRPQKNSRVRRSTSC